VRESLPDRFQLLERRLLLLEVLGKQFDDVGLGRVFRRVRSAYSRSPSS
jgi:hypothetical protein